MQVVTGISPVASLVNWVGGEVTYVYGGCVYALASRTNITSLKDLVDTKVQAHWFRAYVLNMCLMADAHYILLVMKHIGIDVSRIAKLHTPDYRSQGCELTPSERQL